jgi:hypothetical protein
MSATFSREAGGNIQWYRLAEERGLMRFFAGDGICPQHLATSSSLGGVSLLGTNTLIALRLI